MRITSKISLFHVRSIVNKTFKKTLTDSGLKIKILVIRFSSIGDIVLTTPVIRGLKLQLGGEVHFLTKNSFQNLLISNPYLDKVISIEKNVTEVLPQLKAEQYDYIIDLHKNFRSQQLRLALKAKYLTFDKINFEKWLMVNFKHNRLPSEHIVKRYLKAVESLGVKYDGGGLDYFFSTSLPSGLKPLDPLKGERDLPMSLPSNLSLSIKLDDTTDIDEIYRANIEKKLGIVVKDVRTEGKIAGKFVSPFRRSRGFNSEGNYIAFAIGGAHSTKRLPTEKIISICKKLSAVDAEINQPIILLGGKDDATVGEKIVLTINKETIFNACGKLTLDESAWVVKEAKKVITHDTGMMHIAAAFQKEIISIWGNTIPEFGMYPFYKNEVKLNTTIQVENLSCRPCSKIGFDKCPKGHFKCMTEIDEADIINALNS